MFHIILFYIKENFKSYIVAMLLLSVVFVMCGISYESFLTNQTEMSYTEFLDDSIWIYPKDEISEVQNNQMEISYAWQEIVELEKESYACFFLEQFLAENFLQELEGRGFSYEDGVNEVILYGDTLYARYAIGDNIKLNGVSYRVVGKLPSYMPFWNFFYYSHEIESDNTYMHALNGEMFFVNNENAFKGKNALCSNAFCSQKIMSLNNGISMKKAKEKLLEEVKGKQLFEITSIVLLFCLADYFCLVISVIQHKKSGKLLGILLLSGMNRVKYYFFLLVNSFMILGGAIVLYASYMLFRLALFSRQEYFDIRYWMGQQYILCGLCGMLFCILFIFHLWKYRISVLQLLRNE